MARSALRQLIEMSDGDLEEAVDGTTTIEQGAWPLEWYLAELQRRRAERQTSTIVRLTWWIAVMTTVSTLAVVLSLLHVIG